MDGKDALGIMLAEKTVIRSLIPKPSQPLLHQEASDMDYTSEELLERSELGHLHTLATKSAEALAAYVAASMQREARIARTRFESAKASNEASVGG